MQTREYKDKILNEILDWVMDIARSTDEIILPNLATIANRKSEEAVLLVFFGLLLKLDTARAKSKYITEIAIKCHFSDKLNTTVTDAIDSLDKVSEALHNGLKADATENIQDKFKEQFKPDSNLRQKLEILATEVAVLKSQNLA